MCDFFGAVEGDYSVKTNKQTKTEASLMVFLNHKNKSFKVYGDCTAM